MSNALRYVGLALGLAMVALVVVFAAGEGMPNPLKQPGAVRLEFAALGLMVLGALVAFKWGRVGGAAMLAGYAVFTVTEGTANGNWRPSLFAVFALAGAILLIAPPSHRTSAIP